MHGSFRMKTEERTPATISSAPMSTVLRSVGRITATTAGGDQNSNPGKYPNFYNIYRFDHSKLGEWDDSWKTQNDSEGVGKKATFHIYMNNTYAADYKHTRSFK